MLQRKLLIPISLATLAGVLGVVLSIGDSEGPRRGEKSVTTLTTSRATTTMAPESPGTTTGPAPPVGSVQRAIECSDFPFSGNTFRRFKVHDCWTVSLEDFALRFIMGGSDENDRKQGVLIIQSDAGELFNWPFLTPEREGSITVFAPSLSLICYRTEAGTIGAAQTPPARDQDPEVVFLSRPEAKRRCVQ